MAGIFEKMFGKGIIPGGITSKIKEIREKNISRREAVGRVKKLKELKEKKMTPTELDRDAKRISKELGVSYEDALEYIKDERKNAARKESLRKAAGFLGDVGQRARADTQRRYHQPTPQKKQPKADRPEEFSGAFPTRSATFPMPAFKVRRMKFP